MAQFGHVQKLHIKTPASGSWDDTLQPLYLEYSVDGTTWIPIASSFPSTTKHDGTTLTSTEYNRARDYIIHRGTTSGYKSAHAKGTNTSYEWVHYFRQQLKDWGIPYTTVSNNPSIVATDEEYVMYMMNTPIITWKQDSNSAYYDILGIPKDATHLRIWTDYNRANLGLEMNGTTLTDASFNMFFPGQTSPDHSTDEFNYSIISLSGVTLNGNNHTPLLDSKGDWDLIKIFEGEGTYDMLGYSVFVDSTYAIVGMPDDDDNGTTTGATHIYKKDESGNWTFTKKITGSSDTYANYHGQAVSITDDYALVSGQQGLDSKPRVYLYKNSSDTWTEEKIFTVSDENYPNNQIQSSIVFGDYVVIGDYYDDASGNLAGAVYVFKKDEGGADNWGQLKKIIASDGSADSRFGKTVNINDTYLIAGAYTETNGKGTDAGSAYIFKRDEGGTDNWGQLKKLLPSDGEDYGHFGAYDVKITNNYAVVAASNRDGGVTNTAAAYIFKKDEGGSDNWGEVKKISIKNANKLTESHYGNLSYPAGSGNTAKAGLNLSMNDKYLVMGALLDLNSCGSVNIYANDDDNWSLVKKLTSFLPAQYNFFGISVSINEQNDILIGEPHTLNRKGRVYFYNNTADSNYWVTNTISETTNLTNVDNEFSVAMKPARDIFNGNTITLTGITGTQTTDNASFDVVYNGRALNSTAKGAWTQSTGTLSIVIDSDICGNTDLSFNFTIKNGTVGRFNGVKARIEVDGDNLIPATSFSTEILKYDQPTSEDQPDTPPPPTILDIFSNDGAFCALKTDGTVQCWGHSDFGSNPPTDISNVKDIFCSSKTFTALTRNNVLITWGNDNDGSGNNITNVNISKKLQPNRMYGNAVISNVKKHNLEMSNNYKFNSHSYDRPMTQILRETDYDFKNSFSKATLEKINNISLTNGEIKAESMPVLTDKSDITRHKILDTIFSNITDVSFNINTVEIGLEDKLTKTKTKVFKSNQTMNLTNSSTDISTEQAVYSNLSDLSDNITVNMNDSVSFKVTRTTGKGLVGKYNVDVLAGKMVVYGRHYGTIEFGTSDLQLGPYEDGDEVYINNDKFYFGGFGCNKINRSTSNTNKYLSIITCMEACAVLFQNGSVKCFGKTGYTTTSLGLDSGVVKVIGGSKSFMALKSDGSVVVWGNETSYFNNKKNTHIHKNLTTGSRTTVTFDNTRLLANDCIDIYFGGSRRLMYDAYYIKKKDGSVVVIGEATGSSSYYTVLKGFLQESDPDYLLKNSKVDVTGGKFYGLSDIISTSVEDMSSRYFSINYNGKIITWGGFAGYEHSPYNGTYGNNIENIRYGINGTWGASTNKVENSQQNLTIDTMPPVSKVFMSYSYGAGILNNGKVCFWGDSHYAWKQNTDNTINTTDPLTLGLWDKLQNNTIVDAVDSYRDIAFLDISGGVYISGNIYFTYVPTTSEVSSYGVSTSMQYDISQNVVKIISNNNRGFAFLKSDNTAVVYRYMDSDISDYIPEKFLPSVTINRRRSSHLYTTILVTDIENIYNAGRHSFMLVNKSGEGFIINCYNSSSGFQNENRTIIDIGKTIGGSITGIKRVYTNGNATCILKHDDTVVQFLGGYYTDLNTITKKNEINLSSAICGCDYNHYQWGINGIYNGGNGKGGCVLNGDGSKNVLENVKQIIPITGFEIPNDQDGGSGGFIAVINDGTNEYIAVWGCTRLSKKYFEYNNNCTGYDGTWVENTEATNYIDVSQNFTNANISNVILNQLMSNHKNIYPSVSNQFKNFYPELYKYEFNANIIKLTVENEKFLFNNSTASYTFEMGKTYYFDTSDSSNINNRMKVSYSYNTYDSDSAVQFLTPGQKDSFIRFIKMKEQVYFYCDISGIGMGSHYNQNSNPTVLDNVSTVFGGNTERDLLLQYTGISGDTIPDASFNTITIDTEQKKKAVMEALFTVLNENMYKTKKDIFGYQKSAIGIASPLLYSNIMNVINASPVKRGVYIKGESSWSGYTELSLYPMNECLYVNMHDKDDNIYLSIASEFGYSGVTGEIAFLITRTTESNVTAQYSIEFISTFNTVYTSAANFNTSNNSGYFLENDVMDINGIEITFTLSGLITKGSAKKYTNIITTVNSDDKFVFNGEVTKPPSFEYDKNYKFDVSDSSNSGYALKFSKTNSTTSYNTLSFGTPGTANSFVTFTPGSFSEAYVFCSNNGINMGSLYNPMLLNNGISKTNLETVETDSIDANITVPSGFYDNLSGLDNADKARQKNRRRHQFLRTIFASNQDNTTLETTKTNLGFTASYKKTDYKVFNPKLTSGIVNINLNTDSDLTNTKGFYSALEDGDYALITNSSGSITLKVSRTATDGNSSGVYYVENNENGGTLIINKTNSVTYKLDSNPAGPFKDGDSATINYIPLVFGGIGDGSSTNPSEDISKPVLVETFDTIENRIPILPTRAGFIGIASDGNVYGWGGSNNNHLPPGDPDGDYSTDSRITINDISFAKVISDTVLYIDNNGYPKKMSGSYFSLTSQYNVWWDGTDVSSNLTDLSGVVDMVVGNTESKHCAILLRNDGSVAFWSEDNQPAGASGYSFFGESCYPLIDSSHTNFSKVIKIVYVTGDFVLLRENGTVAFIQVRTNAWASSEHLIKGIYWHNSGSSRTGGSLTLDNTLGDSQSLTVARNIFGKVVDIQARGADWNDRFGVCLINDKGQAFIITGNTWSAQSHYWWKAVTPILPHKSVSYDLNSPYFKKTIKFHTFYEWHLQEFEDGTTAVPYYYYAKTGQHNSSTDPYATMGDYKYFNDVFDGELNSDRNGFNLYNAKLGVSAPMKKYFGPLILLHDDTIVPGIAFGKTSNGSVNSYNKYNYWNDETYGIYGTNNGYSTNEYPAYGDISNVKSIHHGKATGTMYTDWVILLKNGNVLTWGKNDIANSRDVSNQLVNVTKIVCSWNSAAALKSDGSVVVWGKTDEGGTFDANTAGSTSTMSNNTLSSGVIDLFSSKYGFTAVKSDGIILWGKYKNYYDDTDNITWSTNSKYVFHSDDNSSYIKTTGGYFDNTGYNKNNKRNYPLYSTTAAQDTIISQIRSLGVSSTNINSLRASTIVGDINSVFIPSTIFSSGDKDDIRNFLIDFIFSISDKQTKFSKETTILSLENKINKDVIDIIKPNLGYIELLDYKYIFKGFYSKMVENDYIVLKVPNDDLFFKITKNAADYTIEKISGTVDLSLNKVSPYNEDSSIEINGFKIKLIDGVMDGSDEVVQKYNCIETTLGGSAYLNKKEGRVITWGNRDHGGYSHDDFHGTGRNAITAYNNPGASLSSGVVSIAASMQGFAALKDDGSVVVWGQTTSGGGNLLGTSEAGPGMAENLTSGVVSVHGCSYGLGALKSNGDFYCWGFSSRVGVNGRATYPSGQFPVKNVAKVYPSYHGFMLIKTDGSLSGIGGSSMGHNPVNLSNSTMYQINDFTLNQFTDNDALQNVEKVYASKERHVAILNDASDNQIKIIGSSNDSICFTNDFKTRRWKSVTVSDHNKFAALDVSGGVVAWGDSDIVGGTLSNPTSGQWMDISGDVSANVVRVMANKWAWMCLRSDNVLVGIRSGSTSGNGWKCYDFENTDNSYKKPPSEYIISKYKLRNIKDIFSSEGGFGAIDVSDNVMCWGYNTGDHVNEVPLGSLNKIYGGDLSGNDISKNRPVALFSNGLSWCCLKEDETIVTWDRANSSNQDHGSNHLHSTYGVNGTMWGGNGSGGGIRNGDGSITKTGNVKNVVVQNTYYTTRGFVAIQEDPSGNQSCVGWGGYSGQRYNYSTPDNDERSFRHIVDQLTSHSPYQFGLENNGSCPDNRWVWLRSNRTNLHEYEEGGKNLTGNPTGFGEVATLIEVYDVADVEADASNSGVDISAIEQLKENKLSEDVDETSASIPTENSVLSGTLKTEGKTPKEIRKQRTNILKLAFANNPKRTKFKIDSSTLGFNSTTTKRKKSNYVVYKVSFGKVTIDLKEDKTLDENTGFFVAMEAGNEATLKSDTGDFKITQSETDFEDGSSKFFVEGVGGTLSRIVNYESKTYDDKSSPQGPFKEGDSATINGVHIDFGSISEGTGNYSFGDPYIKPIFGGISKLPDEKAYYRLFEGKDLFINCYVNKISPEKQEYMEKWFYNKTGYDSKLLGFVTSGFFYNEIFISSENKTMLLDFEKAIIDMDSEDANHFKIENNYEREKENKYLLNAKCNKYSISWPHETYNNIKFIVKIYENPQIDNAISIEVESNVSKCKGLLVRNYKPNLMKLTDIKTLKSKKLNRRLKRAKNKYATKAIKKKNEVWVKM